MNLRAACWIVLALCSPAAGYAADPVLAAAGDIACDPEDPNYNGGAGTAGGCRMRATSDLLVGGGFGRVARYQNPLGRISPAITDTAALDSCP